MGVQAGRRWQRCTKILLIGTVTMGGAVLALAADARAVTPAQKAAAAATRAEATRIGRWSLLIAAVALVVLLPLLLWLLNLIVTWVTALFRRKRPAKWFPTLVVWGWIRGAVVGKDKRLSTSKTVAVIWTYSLASALLSFVIAKWWGHHAAFDAIKKSGVQGEYAVLIGGPIGAAILAKGIVTSQVGSGQSKPDADKDPQATDLVSNDQGDTDLGDLQYVLFNAVALTYFFGQLLASPRSGLPTMPDVLVGLTGVSAVGYVAKKALPGDAREIKKIDPESVSAADWQAGSLNLKIFGSGLLNADGSAPAPDHVRVEDATGGVDASRVTASTTGEGLVVDAEFPSYPAAASGKYDVSVVTKEGNKVLNAGALTVT
jgi:hypothetical protein